MLLSQNFPNPFNPSTTIKYELPKSSEVTLSVYDMLGRQVSMLVNDRRSAGVHEVKFDGSNLASGVYFYRRSEREVSNERLQIAEITLVDAIRLRGICAFSIAKKFLDKFRQKDNRDLGFEEILDVGE
jgi:Secretion system C-terminal sorting domain